MQDHLLGLCLRKSCVGLTYMQRHKHALKTCKDTRRCLLIFQHDQMLNVHVCNTDAALSHSTCLLCHVVMKRFLSGRESVSLQRKNSPAQISWNWRKDGDWLHLSFNRRKWGWCRDRFPVGNGNTSFIYFSELAPLCWCLWYSTVCLFFWASFAWSADVHFGLQHFTLTPTSYYFHSLSFPPAAMMAFLTTHRL